jgi:predicted transcriptional regulator
MVLSDVARLLDAELMCCDEKRSMEISGVCASDLMSDVLAFGQAGGLLLTGLINAQSINTAEVADVAAVVYVRGKRPTDEVIELAREKGIPVLTCCLSMFEACGRMHAMGLESATDLGCDDE